MKEKRVMTIPGRSKYLLRRKAHLPLQACLSSAWENRLHSDALPKESLGKVCSTAHEVAPHAPPWYQRSPQVSLLASTKTHHMVSAIFTCSSLPQCTSRAFGV